ncbi:unannotated protein [freshwater metagenome]|uniref:Unannotated protein n=1 Tax=freshwater metagenome TaxID=449393 RepID=A0A6J6F982_9ZZZZ
MALSQTLKQQSACSATLFKRFTVVATWPSHVSSYVFHRESLVLNSVQLKMLHMRQVPARFILLKSQWLQQLVRDFQSTNQLETWSSILVAVQLRLQLFHSVELSALFQFASAVMSSINRLLTGLSANSRYFWASAQQKRSRWQLVRRIL